MKKTTVRINVDLDLKEKAYEIIEGSGMTPTGVFTSVLLYIVENGRLPFKSRVSENDERLMESI